MGQSWECTPFFWYIMNTGEWTVSFSISTSAYCTGLKITVGHRTMSDQNKNLPDQMQNTPDILADRKNLRQN